MIPVAFLAPNQALAIAIFSYKGQVKVGLIGDYDAMPDLDSLAEQVEASIAELLAAARDPAVAEDRSAAGEPTSA